jgi:hypothetical protein
MTVQVGPIRDVDVPEVAAFLNAELDSALPAEVWARSMIVPWAVDAPNHGFLLRDDGRVVGAYLAFYSERWIRGARERFCNLGAWCVRPEYRVHSVRLLKAMLAQEGYHFTDLSPSGPVVPLNTRLRFRSLDTATALLPNLPWPTLPGRVRISSDAARIERLLTGDELAVYRDHARCAAARHLVIRRGGRSCYVMFRRVRRRGLPLFVTLLHVSDRELLAASIRPLSRYLLLRLGVPFTLLELRVAGRRPWPSRMLATSRPKMYRSDSLTPEDIDDLYSELTCVPW